MRPSDQAEEGKTIPFSGKKLWFAILMGTMLLPAQVLLIPQYIMFKTFGWINTYLPIILPQCCGETGPA